MTETRSRRKVYLVMYEDWYSCVPYERVEAVVTTKARAEAYIVRRVAKEPLLEKFLSVEEYELDPQEDA